MSLLDTETLLTPEEDKQCEDLLKTYEQFLETHENPPTPEEFKIHFLEKLPEHLRDYFIKEVCSFIAGEVGDRFTKQMRELDPALVTADDAYLKEHFNPQYALITEMCPDYQDMRGETQKIINRLVLIRICLDKNLKNIL